MTFREAAPSPPSPPTAAAARRTRLAGYAFALTAGALWGTTGTLSQAVSAEGVPLTSIGFWRVLVGIAVLALWGLVARRDLFRIDAIGLLIVGLLGGALVALFEVAYQFGIAGAGVAGAAALLYTAPVMVAVLAQPLLGERLTVLRLLLAVVVMLGAFLTVTGGVGALRGDRLAAGVAGGLLSAVSYAGTTLMARWAVPRYGLVKVLFFEAIGGVLLIGLILPLFRHSLAPPTTGEGWLYIGGLTLGSVLLANFAFFAGVRRIEAAPTAVAATIEPVVGALLALVFLGEQLTLLGWLGLVMVVGGVSAGYWRETES